MVVKFRIRENLPDQRRVSDSTEVIVDATLSVSALLSDAVPHKTAMMGEQNPHPDRGAQSVDVGLTSRGCPV